MKFLYLFFIPYILFANFMPNESCRECHKTIFEEFQRARHANSSIFLDPIHNAAWKHSPDFKKNKYTCAICHTPTDTNLITAIYDFNQSILPQKDSIAQQNGVACAYCHRIKDIKYGENLNKNIINEQERVYYGNIKNPIPNKFHEYAENKNFKNGNICIGCHSHYKNKYGVNICSYNKNNVLNSLNCVSCHMPKIVGYVADINGSHNMHAFHGFAGIHNDILLMQKYISIEIIRGIDRFFIAINNKAPHALTLHPMRIMQLRVSVIRDNKEIKFPDKNFQRLIGDEHNITLPWSAKKIIKNTSIKGNEKRISTYMYKLKENDIVNVKVGYYLISKQLAKKFALDKDKELNKFILLKQKIFIIKPDKFEPQVE